MKLKLKVMGAKSFKQLTNIYMDKALRGEMKKDKW